MGTKKKRIKIAVSEETIQKLQWIVEEDQKKNNERIYPCDSLERIINNEYVIRKAFRDK
ncbi:addiction module toxin RelE [Enterococcus hirae]|uniref:addiction module toxin RelE n=1 Tax=Enterococcus sp. C52 TaxID=3231313 RepID=UPI0019E715B7|nr:addiction module toxin RelE [Enterococcus hirae]EMF0264763.1 addiction module toxin RelE [Enterococcus hirae]